VATASQQEIDDGQTLQRELPHDSFCNFVLCEVVCSPVRRRTTTVSSARMLSTQGLQTPDQAKTVLVPLRELLGHHGYAARRVMRCR
jgi:hypothetical protein